MATARVVRAKHRGLIRRGLSEEAKVKSIFAAVRRVDSQIRKETTGKPEDTERRITLVTTGKCRRSFSGRAGSVLSVSSAAYLDILSDLCLRNVDQFSGMLRRM